MMGIFKKILCFTLIVTTIVTFITVPGVCADDGMRVIMTDITSTDEEVLKGEAKIKVSVSGIVGQVSIAQIVLEFEGSLEYKSIEFLKGENQPENGNAYIMPNIALANSTGKINASIISAKIPMEFNGETTDLFIITFAGDEGGRVNVELDTEKSYCTVGDEDFTAGSSSSVSLRASADDNEGKTAEIKLIMDKVTDFFAGSRTSGYTDSGVELKIIAEENPGYVIYTTLNNTLISGGGHRENVTLPTFTIKNKVLSNYKYIIEISGRGYVTYKQEGVSFDNELVITNREFVPGDATSDGEITIEDKDMCMRVINGEVTDEDSIKNCDFNRDGEVNDFDLAVFEEVEGDISTVPYKMDKPVLSGGERKMTIKWQLPSDDQNITGYEIQYGTLKANLAKTHLVETPDTNTVQITGLSGGALYYVRIAAINEYGTGPFSEIAQVRTNMPVETPTGGGGGGGGGGGDGGASTMPVIPPIVAVQPQPEKEDKTENAKTFTDLENYSWAQEAVYSLKEKNIINGTSEDIFSPQADIKRGDFILILSRMLNFEGKSDENFSDVPKDSYYYDAIKSAKASGIAKGSENMFRPEETITRQDLITLAYRAFVMAGHISESEKLTVLDTFSDKEVIGEYAVVPMASMVSAGIIKGSDGQINPLGNATRAEVAVMCFRLMTIIK